MPEIMIAVRPGTVYLAGKRRMVRKGRTTAHTTHPIVTEHPKLWQPIRVDYPDVEVEAEREPETVDVPPPDPEPEAATFALEPVDNAAVRAWAAENDVKVSKSGPISASVLDQYRTAQSG